MQRPPREPEPPMTVAAVSGANDPQGSALAVLSLRPPGDGGRALYGRGGWRCPGTLLRRLPGRDRNHLRQRTGGLLPQSRTAARPGGGGFDAARRPRARRSSSTIGPRCSRTSSERLPDGTLAATLMLEGIRCAACIWLNEQHLMRQPGVRTRRGQLRFAPGATRLGSRRGPPVGAAGRLRGDRLSGVARRQGGPRRRRAARAARRAVAPVRGRPSA